MIHRLPAHPSPIRAISVMFALAAACLWLGGTTGCFTASQAHSTTKIVAVSVDGAMSAWGDYVRAGFASTEDEDTVRKAYGAYQGAMRSLRLVVQNYYTGDKDRTDLDKALDAVDAAKNDAIDTILTLINR